jgi:putative copper export protein
VTEAVLPPLQRFLLFSGVLLLVGAVSWRSFVAPWQPPDLRKDLRGIEVRLASLAAALALLLLPVWGMRLQVQVMEFRDPFAPLLDDVRFLLLETFWGKVWFAQGGLLLGLAPLFHRLGRRARRRREQESYAAPGGGDEEPNRQVQSGAPHPPPSAGPAPRLPVGWKAAWTGVILLVLTLSLSSHAMSVPVLSPLAVAMDAGHALAAGAWVGSLALILWLRPRDGRSVPVLAGQLKAFSYVAMGAVALLLLMGTVLGVLHVGEVRNLWASEYGRVFSLKVLAAGGVLLLGFRNWRYGLPVVEGEDGSRSVRRRATLEVGMAALVVLLTAILVGTPMPEGVH